MIRNSVSVPSLIIILVIIASAEFALAASVSVSPVVGPPTTKATATGSGFTAGETVSLTFDTSAAGSAVADSAGNFTQPMLVPKSAQPGAHTVQATGQSSGLLASATFTVQTNWPSFKNVSPRLGVNVFENTINVSNAKFLTLAWQGLMGDLVDFSSPAIVNGVVYIGSFDGKLYAFNANGCNLATCNPLWSGKTANDIVNSPAVANGTVFIGSADHKLYAFPRKAAANPHARPCGRDSLPVAFWKALPSWSMEWFTSARMMASSMPSPPPDAASPPVLLCGPQPPDRTSHRPRPSPPA